jgi:site-specific DNA-cytosine methylase
MNKEKHSKNILDRWEICKKNKSFETFQSVKLDPNDVSPTLIKTHRHWHWLEPRHLTDNELKAICSFPIDYKIKGDAGILLGNAVMPKMMYHIAKHIKENILI